MIKALISLGQGLDLDVSADGVTTPRQRATLQAQGCDQTQGAIYGQPVSAQKAAIMVATSRRRPDLPSSNPRLMKRVAGHS